MSPSVSPFHFTHMHELRLPHSVNSCLFRDNGCEMQPLLTSILSDFHLYIYVDLRLALVVL